MSLVGFVLTLLAVLETQRIEKAARAREREVIERAGKEIEQARQAITVVEQRWQQTVEGIVYRDLRELCAKAEKCLRAGEASLFKSPGKTERKWKEAQKDLSEARMLCVRIVNFAPVTVEEKGAINVALRDLDSVLRVVGRLGLQVEAKKQQGGKSPPPAGSTGGPQQETTPPPVEAPPDGTIVAEPSQEPENLVTPVQTLLHLMVAVGSRAEQSLYR